MTDTTEPPHVVISKQLRHITCAVLAVLKAIAGMSPDVALFVWTSPRANMTHTLSTSEMLAAWVDQLLKHHKNRATDRVYIIRRDGPEPTEQEKKAFRNLQPHIKTIARSLKELIDSTAGEPLDFTLLIRLGAACDLYISSATHESTFEALSECVQKINAGIPMVPSHEIH